MQDRRNVQDSQVTFVTISISHVIRCEITIRTTSIGQIFIKHSTRVVKVHDVSAGAGLGVSDF